MSKHIVIESDAQPSQQGGTDPKAYRPAVCQPALVLTQTNRKRSVGYRRRWKPI